MSGLLQICVQSAVDANQSSLAAHQRVNDLAEQAAASLAKLQLPATWALSHYNIELLPKIADRMADHEIALLADASWRLSRAPRHEFAGELGRRLDLFRNQQHDVSTLVLHNSDLGQHVEALAELGIDVVRQSADPLVRDNGCRATSPRYGVLMVRPSAVFPGQSGMVARWDRAYSAKRVLWKAVSKRTVQHVAVDLGALATLPNSALRQLECWLRLVARLRDAGRLQIELLSQASLRCCPSAPNRSSRSILRPAA